VDLKLPPSATAFGEQVRNWLRRHLSPEVVAAASHDDDDSLAVLRRWNATLVDAGYGAVSWPRAYGGLGVGPVQEMVFNQEMARADAPGPVNTIGVANIGPAIMAVGTDEQRARFLRPMLRGDELWCQGMSEPDAGSDLASLRTRAVLDGDHFVVTGQKTWTSDGHRADWCQLYVRTDAGVPKHEGISALLVDMSTPGIDVRRITTMAGDFRFSELLFDDVRVPVANLLGELHGGWRVATTTLGFERAGVVKLHLAVRRKLDRLRQDLVSADQGGAARPADRTLRDEIARRHIEVECLRLLATRAVSTGARDGVPGPEGSLAKLRWAEAEQALAATATRVLGLGALAGEWGRNEASSRSLSIAGGTTEINKDILAERVLGLPRR